MMSGAIAVDDTAGGTAVIQTTAETRLLLIANTGEADAFLKLDASATALTAANGHPLAAGEKLTIGLSRGPDGAELQTLVKAICATAEDTTIVAQCLPN